ncbi:MAG: polysaccharide pyruvyl transferase CsaB [Bacillota bacterium]|jgi:polysaccharide pyruvyl transferase CsaB|nr:polysaccharide pyruvyl transferase CsaB [Bacillota bacterium]NLL60704.1 polysaccharide pyruvyl transferase CsaB [Tissierellia bacterium]
MDVKRILIIGYYGSGNAGDEALLRAAVNLLNKVYTKPDITAITYSVKDTEKTHGIKGISRNKYMDIVQGIINSDILVGGGGSMLQNVTSNRSLYYYLAILMLAKLFGKKAVLLGNGIGPLKTSLAEKITIKILKSLDYIVLRDDVSFEFLKNHNMKNIYLGNDLAFSLDIDKKSETRPKRVIINLRDWFYDEKFIDIMVDFIEYLGGNEYEIVLLPFQKGNDDRVLQKIKDKIEGVPVKYCENLNFEDIILEISSGEVFIGMRLHGLIFSAILNKPFIALAYDPKVEVFSEKSGQIYFKDLNKITLKDLIESFNKLYENLEEHQRVLRKNTEEMTSYNYINEEILKYIK